jgi:hypothetical protein
MSNAIYLVASLPMLQFGEPPPFKSEDFRFRCQGILSDTELADLDAILNGIPGSHPFVVAYEACESQIRNATARARSIQWGSEARFTERMHPGFDVALSKRVVDALGKPNPLEREEELARTRWWVADQLVGCGEFSMAHVYAFAVKLMINERFFHFDLVKGNAVIEQVIQENDRAVVQN